MRPRTIIEAQQRYIDRVNGCHTGHRRRVARAAWKELHRYATARELDAQQICIDARDMAELERNAED